MKSDALSRFYLKARTLKRLCFLLSLCLLLASPAWAANWYVRSGCGTNGSGTGSSCGSAWNSFANTVWSSIQPGDTLYVIGMFTERLNIGAVGSSGSGNITIRGDHAAGAGQIGNGSTPEYVCVNSYNTISNITIYGNIRICEDWTAFTSLQFIASSNEIRDFNKTFISNGFTTDYQFKCGGTGVANTHTFKVASVSDQGSYERIIVETAGAMWAMVDDGPRAYELTKFRASTTNVTVTNSTIYTTGDTWISVIGLDAVSNLTISNNEINGGGYAGKGAFYLDGNDYWKRPSNQLLSNNYIHDIGSATTTTDDAHCIGVQAVDNLTITGNHMKNCAAGIIIYPGASDAQKITALTITRNFIQGMNHSLHPTQFPGCGIMFSGVNQCPLCDAATVAYNIITTPINCNQTHPDYECVGIGSKWSVQNKYYNNVLVGNDTNFCDAAQSGISADLRNNISYNPSVYHSWIYPSVGAWTEDYNIYYPDPGTKFKIGGNEYNYSNYIFHHPAGISGAHIIISDPLFTGPSSFTLQSSSPAIDKADNTVWSGKPNVFDFTGVTKITDASGKIISPGGVVNIGAYETQGSTLASPTLRILAD